MTTLPEYLDKGKINYNYKLTYMWPACTTAHDAGGS